MTKARRTVAGIVAGAAAAAIAFAPTAATSAADLDDLGDLGKDYVTVSNDNGVIHIGTGVPGQPLVGASIDTNTGNICVGFSYQMPFCTFDRSALGATTTSAIPSPVWVDADNSDGRVGAGVRIGTGSIAGVSYSSTTGQLCVGIGMAPPYCAQLT